SETAILVLGGAHDLSDNVPAGVELIVLTVKGYPAGLTPRCDELVRIIIDDQSTYRTRIIVGHVEQSRRQTRSAEYSHMGQFPAA
ncbi:MAG: hypothetical protein ACI8P0_006712, partial [Planctomycetaceae bacterium]